jgi:glycerate dehydrogenase
VANVAGYSSDSVAQVTVATVLYLYTHLRAYTAYVDSGEYSRGNCFNRLEPVYHEIAGKTWGIIGYGNIGKRVAHVAEALGCSVIAYTRTPRKEVACVGLEELCHTSDIITVHTPLTSETRGLIGERELALMPPGCVLVNEARGAVLDEAAVARSVLEGKIAFGCDVYAQEPFAPDHPYRAICALENVCLTPHMAWGASEARQRCLDEIVRNIAAFAAGERRNRVD